MQREKYEKLKCTIPNDFLKESNLAKLRALVKISLSCFSISKKFQNDCFRLNQIPNKVMTDINMLCPRMLYWIFRNVDSASIITIQIHN